MSLLHGRSGREIAVALTYNLDLAWFEALVYPALRARGVRQVVIFADARRVSETLESQGPLLHGAGSWYQVVPVRLANAFHPKALLLTGDDGATLHVGTGNLTGSGYGRNLEAFESWEIESGASRVHPCFEQFRRFLEELVASALHGLPARVGDVLDEAFSFPVLSLPPEEPDGRGLAWSIPGRSPLLEQITQPPTPASSVRCIAPFFDADGHGALQLLTRLRASSAALITDESTTTLRAAALERLEAAGATVRLLARDADAHRPLHAKLFHARGEGWELGYVGSANLSRAGWLGHNVELGVLRSGAAGARVGELLDGLEVRELTPTDRSDWLQSPLPENDAGASTGPAVLDARFDTDRHVVANHEGTVAGVEVVLAGRSVGVDETEARHGRLTVQLERPARGTGVVLIRAFDDREVGPWALVADPMALAERAERGRAAADAVERMAFAEYDPSEMERLFQVLTRIYRDREPARETPRKEDTEGQGTDRKHRFVRVSEDDFTSDGSSSLIAATKMRLRLVPTRLMESLLFGGKEELDSDQGEGESGDVDTEVETSPESDEGSAETPRPRGTRATRDRLARDTDRLHETYFQNAFAGLRNSRRLLEDLMVLTAPLHLLARRGEMGSRHFLIRLATVLRRFLGSGRAPLARSVAMMDEEERAVFWRESPAALQLHLLTYNSLLALVANHDPSESKVPAERAVLWLGRLLRTMPEDVREGLAERARRRAPALTRGIFWLGGTWPSHVDRMPFPDFVERTVRNAKLLEDLASHLRPLTTDPRVTARGSDLDVVHVDGLDLYPGFTEEDDHNRVLAHVATDPFCSPEPFEWQRKMQRPAPESTLDLEAVAKLLPNDQEDAISLLLQLS
ncbi:MAG: hypothetical protein JJ863_17660 [Deltaproteobacteria bacterium]|nr:hypothetical protein [Deltaproteobacteria bacterium]